MDRLLKRLYDLNYKIKPGSWQYLKDIVGENADDDSDLVERIIAAGHAEKDRGSVPIYHFKKAGKHFVEDGRLLLHGVQKGKMVKVPGKALWNVNNYLAILASAAQSTASWSPT
jgi:hypothetical protein